MDEREGPAHKRLYQALLSLKTRQECEALLEDLCTIQELNDMVKRLEAARLLDAGANYQDVGRETGMSTATISRVNRCLRYGAGGYRTVLDRLKQEGVPNAD